MSVSSSVRVASNQEAHEVHQLAFPEKRTLYTILLYTLWMGIGALPLIEGMAYYLSPIMERPYSELHELYKPSGLIGQGLGILGTLMMIVGVSSYMLRKRWSVLHRFGTLKGWLATHIFLCTLGPFLVLLHTSFKFGNIASISFWSMALVVSSGIFGRYVYVRIPKTVNGQFLSPRVIHHAQQQLIQRIAGRTNLSPEYVQSLTRTVKPSGRILGAMYQSILFEIKKKRLRSHFDKELESQNVDKAARQWVVPLLIENAYLQLRVQVMQPFIRAFGYWHVLHIPLALVMLIALIVHIVVAITFGYTWIF